MANTDVAHSIAGYYFQVLLACNELVGLLNTDGTVDNDWVGIEKGSDIRVFRHNGTDISIESKFYGNDRFTKNHSSIRHTIYNFYNDFEQRKNSRIPVGTYRYETNVGVSDSNLSFFKDWTDKTYNEIDLYINYVKQCLVYESIKKNGRYKTNFENFKSRLKVSGNVAREDTFSCWYDLLLEQIRGGHETYHQYANIDDSYVVEFIDKVDFEFRNQAKVIGITSLYDNIGLELQKFNSDLDNDFCHSVRNYLIEKFFETTIIRTDVNQDEEISVYRLKKIIDQTEQIQLNILHRADIKTLINYIEQEAQNIELVITGYSDELKSNILGAFITITGSFTESYKNSSLRLEEFISGYSMDNEHIPLYNVIPSLSRIMSLIATYTGLPAGEVQFKDGEGINNCTLHIPYALKSMTSNVSDSQSAVLKFMGKELKSHKFPKGNEIVVLDFLPDTDFEPCKYTGDEIGGFIESVVTEYTQTYDILRDQLLYKSLDYRCSKCLRTLRNSNATMENIKRFVELGCKG